ncbi:MAG: cyclic nucleotide-binding domain-containing protein, partial [Myxococcota bacterium]
MTADSMLQTLAARLRTHPPFDRLGDHAIEELVPAMEVRWVDRDEVLFEAGQTPVDEIWLVHKGAIRLDRGGELAAMCEPGDLLGARAHLAGRAYVASAVVDRDALLYTWPATRFLEWIERYPRLAIHLASGFAVEGPIGHLADAKPAVAQQVRTVEPVRDLLTCGLSSSVRDAATRMSVHRVGSCLVLDADARPVGIVTDVDLRRKVVAVGL